MEDYSVQSENIQSADLKKHSYSKREVSFAFISLILGFCFIKLIIAPAFINELKIGLGASITMLFAIFFCLFFSSDHKKITGQKALRILLSIAFTVNIFISSNTLIQQLDMIFVMLILAYDKLSDTDEKYDHIRKLFPADLFYSVLILPFNSYTACRDAVKASAEKSNAGKNIKNAVIGLAIALPSTIVVCILLMSADDNFSDIISDLFDNGLSKIFTFIFQFAVGIPIAFYIYGACYGAAKKTECKKIPNDENIITELKSLRFLPSTAGFFSALPVCILYVIFFFSQITYFLSSFSSKLPKDMESYSEYARQGFFELCIVAVINLAIIIAVNLFCKYNENAKRPFSISLITCILSAFTLILISTAVSKMIMYIDVYGLTLLRIYTTWFMILLAFIFIGIFLSVVLLRINLSKLVVIVFTIMFSLLSFCNIDGIIAKYNTERYLNGSLEYLNEDVFETLAPDSIKYSINLIGKLKGKKGSNAELEAIIEAKATESQRKDLRTITIGDIIAADIWKEYSDK